MYPLPDDARLFPRRPVAPRLRYALLTSLCALLLAVPVFAEADPGLAPSASASGCRPVGKTAQCSIVVSFDEIDAASYYTVTLTRPDEVVIPYGAVDAGSTELAFDYAGDGAYIVAITAYGTTETAEPAEVDSENAEADVPAKS